MAMCLQASLCGGGHAQFSAGSQSRHRALSAACACVGLESESEPVGALGRVHRHPRASAGVKEYGCVSELGGNGPIVTLSDDRVILRPWSRDDARFMAQASADP